MFIFAFGSRSGVSPIHVSAVLSALNRSPGGPARALWSGDAPGADSFALQWARSKGVKCRCWNADWPRFGRSAGVRRSAALVKAIPYDPTYPGVICVCFAGCVAPVRSKWRYFEQVEEFLSAGSMHTFRFCRYARHFVTVEWACGSRWSFGGGE